MKIKKTRCIKVYDLVDLEERTKRANEYMCRYVSKTMEMNNE